METDWADTGGEFLCGFRYEKIKSILESHLLECTRISGNRFEWRGRGVNVTNADFSERLTEFIACCDFGWVFDTKKLYDPVWVTQQEVI